MTREEALEQQACEDWYDVPSDEMTLEQARQAVKDLRKKLAEYLEQQPCDDCISRQAVNDLVDELARAISDERCYISRGRSTATIMQDILDLPSVTPKEKTGKWIYTGDYITDGMLKCSSCGYEHDVADRFLYCPNCGAKMIKPQESEEI
jgi:rubrerythrin